MQHDARTLGPLHEAEIGCEAQALTIGKLPAPSASGRRPTAELMWPVSRPRSVLEAFVSSFGCMLIAVGLQVAVVLSSPHGNFRQWLEHFDAWSSRFQICFTFVSAIVAYYLLCTAHRDPGYLEPDPDGLDEILPTPQEQSQQSALDVPLRWCQYCHLVQPRRTRHCKECGLCVRTFDHHCFWIGGCVGEFNHLRFFFMLIAWTGVMWWQIHLTFSCTERNPHLLEYLSSNWHILAVASILLGYQAMNVGLLLYHIYLIGTAQTTWEHLCREKIDYLKPFPRGVHPFDAGGFDRNLIALCNRRRQKPKSWQFTWRPGQPIPFNIFDNQYYSCF